MVMNATNLSRSGLRDWLIQRVSSLVLGAYFLFLTFYMLKHPNIDFSEWSELFAGTCMRICTLLALLALMCHGWIGLWTISTDYFTERMQGKKALCLRLFFQGFFALLLLVYVIWGVQIIWGL